MCILSIYAYLLCNQGIALFLRYLVYEINLVMISYSIEIIILSLIQGISELLKSYYAMTRGKWPGKQ